MLLNNLTLAVMFLKELLQNPLEQYREEDTINSMFQKVLGQQLEKQIKSTKIIKFSNFARITQYCI